jgi:ribose transport system substrate-binding protein
MKAVRILAMAAAMSALAAPALAQPSEDGWPFTGTLPDGSTFTLKPEIAAKARAGEPINYVFSNPTSTTDIFSAQYLAGYERSLEPASAIYPLNPKIVSPSNAYDANQQIAQIEALINSSQVDCLSIAVNGADTFTNVTTKALEAGIPVFSVGAPTNGNELGQFTQIPEVEGVQTAEVVLDWAADNGVELKDFMMSSGAPASTWAQGRMISFQDTIKAAVPDAVFSADAANALNTTFEPPKAFDAYKAFLIGHPDVQVLLSADQGAGSAAKAIEDLGLKGKVWSVGWNPSFDQLDAIDNDLQIAVMDQKWSDQAGFGAEACATLFATGEILPNTQVLVPVTKENSAESRAFLTDLLGEQ